MVKGLLKKILFWPTSPLITKLIGDPILRYNGRRKCGIDVDFFKVKSALVIRLDEIGDVVMTTPFLRELRQTMPDAWITLVVLSTTFNLVENCPYVNEVLYCDWTGDRDLYRLHRHWRALTFAKKHFHNKKFDLAVLPRRDADQAHGAFLAYFSGAPRRIGYSDITSGGPKLPYYRNAGRLFTHILSGQALRHEVEYGLCLIHYIGGRVKRDNMEIWLSPEDESVAEQILKSHNIQETELLIGFAVGAGHPKRIWPISNYCIIANWLKNRHKARILVLGDANEIRMGNELWNCLEGGVVNLVGETTLRQAGALLKSCNLYVGNDNGLMHIAAAMGVSVVEISCHPQNGFEFHPNSPVRFGPWGVFRQILQPEMAIPPCTDACTADEAHCIRKVTVEQVKGAITYILSSQCQSKV